MASTSVPVITLPRPALMRQWLAQYRVPAVGVAIATGGKVAFKVYGELSKGIPAPQNTVWGSKALTDATAILNNTGDGEPDNLPQTDFFTGLNMPDTSFGDPVKVLNRMARPHNNREGIYVFKPYDTDSHLFTTLSDLCKLLIHIGKKVNDIAMAGTTAEEYGWRALYSTPGGYQGITHSAVGNGASHSLLLFPRTKQAVVILTNSDNGGQLTDTVISQCWPSLLHFAPLVH
ncbi:hypothetical protein BEL04_16950 [Mucilaginibacter sp. PPCGB 2223]|uniref:serine hydrolase n=1 Tax=Mucilaginibacter sp. PPCGB 2223 TaxID=1886027 RepID=UPI00082613DB|nr:serine hydrolase [Mucilaginibacter sp. PPCGB 2223]OCX51704.1 hypothetical protein BEL04_16950 [Mucilaginibacter sp. PPCGB 2223]